MAKLVRAVVAVFWLISAGLLGFMAYVVIQTETSPQALWGWLAMCGLALVSATFIAYGPVFGAHHRE